jgi:hypothetical protein
MRRATLRLADSMAAIVDCAFPVYSIAQELKARCQLLVKRRPRPTEGVSS